MVKISKFVIGTITALALIGSIISVRADKAPNNQWMMVETSLFDLVQAGHRIVTVMSQPDSSIETFYLQKGEDVHMCEQVQSTRVKPGELTGLMRCFKLVPPYYSPPK
jgi:hypothetical protein